MTPRITNKYFYCFIILLKQALKYFLRSKSEVAMPSSYPRYQQWHLRVGLTVAMSGECICQGGQGWKRNTINQLNDIAKLDNKTWFWWKTNKLLLIVCRRSPPRKGRFNWSAVSSTESNNQAIRHRQRGTGEGSRRLGCRACSANESQVNW